MRPISPVVEVIEEARGLMVSARRSRPEKGQFSFFAMKALKYESVVDTTLSSLLFFVSYTFSSSVMLGLLQLYHVLMVSELCEDQLGLARRVSTLITKRALVGGVLRFMLLLFSARGIHGK